MSIRPQYSFLQQLPWQRQALNALQYNTSQTGSVVKLVYGTRRVQVNLIAFANFQGPGGGKKGKGVGPLPIGGTNTVSGKGGGGKGGGKKGKKKGPQDFSIDVDFGICQGPISGMGLIFANASVANFSDVGLNLYAGIDGQQPDPTFNDLGDIVGYSGTCHITGTPMDLGMSPVIPNLSCEVFAILDGSFPGTEDADASQLVSDFLTNERYGCFFPAANLDPDIQATYGNYCIAAGLPVSVELDAQQKATEWIDGLAKLTNTAIVWSAALLKFIPYGDLALNNNGVSWAPNLTPVYALTDEHFLQWHPRGEEGGDPQTGEDDPVIITRSNPADADNWLSMQFSDRSNFYDENTLAVFDQGMIDLYGRRDGEALPGKIFCDPNAAAVSAQLFLQRRIYIRNTYRFKLGWQFALLEPMDIVLISEASASLDQQPVRITSIEEDANGDLTIEAEEVVIGAPAPAVVVPAPPEISSGAPLPPANFIELGGFSSGEMDVTAAFFPSHEEDVGASLGLFVPDPSVVVVFVAYLQYANVDGSYLDGYDADPEVIFVTSSSLLTFQRRAYQVMYPAVADRGPNPVLKHEMWWAPAPNPLTNEFVTVTFSSMVREAAVTACACLGFSTSAINNFVNGTSSPWDTNATIFAENDGTDVSVPVAVTNESTMNGNDALLCSMVKYFWVNPDIDPSPAPAGIDGDPLSLDAIPFPSTPNFADSYVGQAFYARDAGIFQQTALTNVLVGQWIYTSGGVPWPVSGWMMLADALHYS